MSAGLVLSNIASKIEQRPEITIVNTSAKKNTIIISLVGYTIDYDPKYKVS